MVVNLVCILIETTKGVYLVTAAVGDRRVDQTGRSLTKSPCNRRAITISAQSPFDGGIWHKKGVVRGCRRSRSQCRAHGIQTVGSRPKDRGDRSWGRRLSHLVVCLVGHANCRDRRAAAAKTRQRRARKDRQDQRSRIPEPQMS